MHGVLDGVIDLSDPAGKYIKTSGVESLGSKLRHQRTQARAGEPQVII